MFLNRYRENEDLKEKASSTLRRDAKHALNSPDQEERLLGVRAVQSLLYE